MRKINELASLTGMTTRALRYYDQIGLLKPAEISESGYRLYDDKALETLCSKFYSFENLMCH